jgi:carbamoyl-phosphate synthase large subunit
MKTVMTTGTGAIIGYGVLKALREARPDFKLVAADIFPDAVGQYWADAFEVAPLTSDATYKSWLRDLRAEP